MPHSILLKIVATIGLSIVLLWPSAVIAQSPTYVRGDCNTDAAVNIGDAIWMLGVLFTNAGPESCTDACDGNDDGALDVADPVFLLTYLFTFGPEPAAPFPLCGTDPTPDSLTCDSFPPCSAELEIELEQGISGMTISAGDNQFVAFVISVTGLGGTAESVTFSQEIEPDTGGISIASDYPGGWTPSTDQALVVNAVVTALIPGTYTITSTAFVAGLQAQETLTVTVTDGLADPIELNSVGMEPGAVALGVSTAVDFTCLTTGTTNFPSTITLNQVESDGSLIATIGELFDDGNGADLAADDQVYGGTFSVQGMTEGLLYYQAVSGSETSPVTKLLVSPLPIGIQGDDPAQLIPDSGGGGQMYADQVLCKVSDLTDSSGIQAAVAAVGGTIEGLLPRLGIVCVGIDPNGTAQRVYDMAALLEAQPGIESAEPNRQDEIAAFTPNDPSYASQTNMTVVRADEAWAISRGTTTIAVIDTGVDYNHPDLDSKVIIGWDFVDGDNDPADPNSHGTHVAGIAAAESNNGNSVAGASWGSSVLAIRGIGSHAVFASSVRFAADAGVKIINYSGGGSNSATKRNAVLYAVGKGVLFVAAAGNSGANTNFWPGSYPEVLCVGNSTNADGRAGSSTFGAQVDICAPGVSVTSTVPGGGVGPKTGTSMSSPLVAGAAAVVWSMHPAWTAAQVRTRLLGTAKPMAAGLLIGNRLDMFEAVFNGSFELGDLGEWIQSGSCSSLTSLGPLVPQHRNRMGYCSTGPAGDQSGATLQHCFEVQPGVTSLPIKFEYNFITEEFPEWVGTQFDDFMNITITAPDGTVTNLAAESVNASLFVPIGGMDFPGGDLTVGHTNWQTAMATIAVTSGPGQYIIDISDTGDDIYDSVVLIDNIRLK